MPSPEPDRLLNRELAGVSSLAEASFEERRNMLLFLETNVLDSLARKNALRKTAGEPICTPPPVGEASHVISGFEFRVDPATGEYVHKSPEGFSVTLDRETFMADVENVMNVIAANREILNRIVPADIRIGVKFPAMNAIGACDPPRGRIFFYRDEHGGLLATGLFEETASDEMPVSLDNVICHEFAHAFVRANLTSVRTGERRTQAQDWRDRAVSRSLPLGQPHIEYVGEWFPVAPMG